MNAHLRKGLLLAIGLGAGIGLMAGSVLVAIADDGRPTDAEIRQRATELGMVDLATYQAPAANLPTPPAEPATAPPPKEILSFVVVKGMGFGEIGKMLILGGLQIDVNALSDRARERGLASHAQPGTYSLTTNDPDHPVTLDAIIDLVTAKSR